MRACGIMDFDISAINFPDQKRIKKILAALINFTKFREERLNLFLDLQDKSVSVSTTSSYIHQRLGASRKTKRGLGTTPSGIAEPTANAQVSPS